MSADKQRDRSPRGDGNRGDRPVLITGAAGFIGQALSKHLEKAGYTVVGLDLHGSDYDCDLTDAAAMRDTLADIADAHGDRIRAVIHLAAYFDFTGEDHPLYTKLNVDGTRHLLQALARYRVERFIYTSTMLVHEPTVPGVPLTERSPLEPKWAYPISKLAAERTIRQTISELAGSEEGSKSGDPIPFSILRLAGLYHEDCGSPTLSHQIQRIYEKQLTRNLYAGDPGTGQCFLHLDDALEAVALTVEKAAELPAEHTALIGEEEVMSYQALNNAISQFLFDEPLAVMELPHAAAKAGARMQLVAEKVIPDSLDHGEPPFIRPFMIDLAEDHYEIDGRYAAQTLGFRPRHRLSDELELMLERLKEDPRRFYERNGLQPPHWLERFGPEAPNPAVWRDEVLAREGRQHAQSLWLHLLTLALGLWLVTTPVTVGSSDPLMLRSDVLAGAGIAVFSLLSLSIERRWARWVTAALGLWVAFAPLVFWTESASLYLNDTLIGTLVACLALGARPVVGPGVDARADSSVVPHGWDYSPSSWLQRLPIIALAFIGLFISRYLAAYQLGHTTGAWDPFFGDGTERVITSRISEAWPVADAGLGAYVYLLEILAGVVGSQRRWRTMPWLVLLFGFLIVPLGAVSIYFIIIQPILIGTWCSLCLVAAAAMLLQIPYSFDEIVATLQFMHRRIQKGESWLRLLLFGDAQDVPATAEARGLERRASREGAGAVPDPLILRAPPAQWLREMLLSGLTVPWTLAASVVVGVALMCSRLIAGTDGGLADSDHLIGSLVIVVSVSALAEVARPLRLINVLLGCALIGAPFLFSGGTLWSTLLDVTSGVVLIALALPRGPIVNQYGRFDRYLI